MLIFPGSFLLLLSRPGVFGRSTDVVLIEEAARALPGGIKTGDYSAIRLKSLSAGVRSDASERKGHGRHHRTKGIELGSREVEIENKKKCQ
jgi:hypothetical protein